MDDHATAGTDVGAGSADAVAPDRCPHCGARRDDGISWCAQCYADLRPDEHTAALPPAREPDPVELDRAKPDRVEVDRAELDRAELDRAELDRVSEAMLAQLAARRPGGRGSSLVAKALDGRLATTLTVTVGTVLLAATGMALLYLVGALL